MKIVIFLGVELFDMKKIFLIFNLFLCFCAFSVDFEKIEKIGEYKCGKQPKQVLFSPDSKYIVMPLLQDNGFDIFDVEKKAILKRISPKSAKHLGFAEGLFIPEKNAFFVSQMTTGKIHEYSYPEFEYKRTISTGGEWCKYMVYSAEQNILAVSNWVTNDVSIIDYESGKVLQKIKTSLAPRGLSFIDNGEVLIVLCFDGGKIQKFVSKNSKSDYKKVSEIKVEKSAMRHIVVNESETKAYVSDMFFASIYEINLADFKITKKIKVFNNPNTIDILKTQDDEEILFVSCRGPNNKVDYTKRSPVNGKIYIINTKDMSVKKIFEGGNQPTGLDIDKKGEILCFSNFQDQNIELYKINY